MVIKEKKIWGGGRELRIQGEWPSIGIQGRGGVHHCRQLLTESVPALGCEHVMVEKHVCLRMGIIYMCVCTGKWRVCECEYLLACMCYEHQITQSQVC